MSPLSLRPALVFVQALMKSSVYFIDVAQRLFEEQFVRCVVRTRFHEDPPRPRLVEIIDPVGMSRELWSRKA